MMSPRKSPAVGDRTVEPCTPREYIGASACANPRPWKPNNDPLRRRHFTLLGPSYIAVEISQLIAIVLPENLAVGTDERSSASLAGARLSVKAQALFTNFSEAEFMQYRSPVGRGPSSNTCPRWCITERTVHRVADHSEGRVPHRSARFRPRWAPKNSATPFLTQTSCRN